MVVHTCTPHNQKPEAGGWWAGLCSMMLSQTNNDLKTLMSEFERTNTEKEGAVYKHTKVRI
jgi:hypothetical protein